MKVKEIKNKHGETVLVEIQIGNEMFQITEDEREIGIFVTSLKRISVGPVKRNVVNII